MGWDGGGEGMSGGGLDEMVVERCGGELDEMRGVWGWS